jgi:hypothetical protein
MDMDGYGRYEDPPFMILMGSHRLFIAQKSFFSGDHNSDNMTYPIDLGELAIVTTGHNWSQQLPGYLSSWAPDGHNCPNFRQVGYPYHGDYGLPLVG